MYTSKLIQNSQIKSDETLLAHCEHFFLQNSRYYTFIRQNLSKTYQVMISYHCNAYHSDHIVNLVNLANLVNLVNLGDSIES